MGLRFPTMAAACFVLALSEEVIHTFHFKNGLLSSQHDIRLRDIKSIGIPAGLALSTAANGLCVANLFGQNASEVDLRKEKSGRHSPDGRICI